MDELPVYETVRQQDREKEGVHILESEDEETSDFDDTSDCERALLSDPEKLTIAPSSYNNRLRHVLDRALPWLRLGLHWLLPSFMLPRPPKPVKLHPTAWLDGLRGIASLLVTLHHASLLGFSWTIHDGWAPGAHQVGWFIRLPIIRLLVSGPPQVAIFFVVSGYAISHKALKLSHQNRFAEVGMSLFSSVFRRHTRLFLPAAIVVFCSAMMPLLDPTWFGSDGFPDVAVPTRTVPQSETLLGNLRNWYDAELGSTRPIQNGIYEQDNPHVIQNPYDPNLWTLPLEFSSSMVVFLFLMAGARLRNRVRIALAFLLIVYLEYNFDFVAILMFLSGMLICDVHFEVDKWFAKPEGGRQTSVLPTRGPWARVRTSIGSRALIRVQNSCIVQRVLPLSAFVLALWLLSAPEAYRGLHESWGFVTLSAWAPAWYGDHILYPLGAILLVLVVDYTPFLQSLFTNRFSQYMGRISYSLYLIHGPLLWSVGLKLAHYTIENITGGDTNEKYFFGMMLAFAMWWPMAIYLADLTVRHVDDNCVWLARWAYEKLSKTDA